MGRCVLCQHESPLISSALRLCTGCIKRKPERALPHALRVHADARRPFGLPASPPRSEGGRRCKLCANECLIGEGELGYCGIRANRSGRLSGVSGAAGRVSWYHDPLPTNCVASWVCPADTDAGYPRLTHTRGPEYGYVNMAVFYEACSFDCLFCQNWHFRDGTSRPAAHSADELADAAS